MPPKCQWNELKMTLKSMKLKRLMGLKVHDGHLQPRLCNSLEQAERGSSAREVVRHIQLVKITMILNQTGYMLTSSGFSFIHLKHNLQISLKRLAILLKFRTSTGHYFSNSTGSSTTNRWFSPLERQRLITNSVVQQQTHNRSTFWYYKYTTLKPIISEAPLIASMYN